MKTIKLNCGSLFVQPLFCELVTDNGLVYANKIFIVSRVSTLNKTERVFDLKLENENGFLTGIFNIDLNEFQNLAAILTASHIDDRLDVLKNNSLEGQKKSASDATDQVTTEAILLND